MIKGNTQFTVQKLNKFGEPISEELTIKMQDSPEISNNITIEVEATKEYLQFANDIKVNSESVTYLNSSN